MADEVKEAPAQTQAVISTPVPTSTPIPTPVPPATSASKAKAKPEKVKVKLSGAGSCSYEGIVLRKNETVELEASQAERFIQTGLFVKV